MLAFSNDYYGLIFRATQSVELFCAYNTDAKMFTVLGKDNTGGQRTMQYANIRVSTKEQNIDRQMLALELTAAVTIFIRKVEKVMRLYNRFR